ncbi:MAG: radical SAM protein [Anaerolineae bacterium]|nr:radical SAM protein [Anaerolineae bacterium]
MNPSILRLHHYEADSRVNGPGQRFVVWVQGCTLNCPGCFNPQTHSNSQGFLMDVDELYQQIYSQSNSIEGVTISGGEPLFQAPVLEKLLKRVKEHTSLSVVLLSGFALDEIKKMPAAQKLLSFVDVLIAGRFDINQRLNNHLIGSANKFLHFLTPRYTPADFNIDNAEVFIHEDGTIILSGFDPLIWK